MRWIVLIHPEAAIERAKVPGRERAALDHGLEKLREIGPNLGYPHSSSVRNTNDLREVRPRAGRSPWRAFYRQIGDVFVVAAVGPEAQRDPRGFQRAVEAADDRLAGLDD